jgi:Domain of unknown function (DUF4367)
MEKDLKQIKSQMLKDELSGFVFTEEMHRQVLNEIDKKHGKKRQIFKPIIPITVTAAFLVISSAGIYHIANIQNQPNQQSEEPSVKTPAEEEEEKPILVFPGYIPEGYEFMHTKTNDEVNEHVFVKKDTEDSFSYRIQNKVPTYPEDTKGSIQLSQNLQGTISHSQELTALIWEHDGYFHIVEQKGSMKEIEFLKIADSIIAKQGFESALDEEIAKLEKETEETEKQNEADTNSDNKETMNEVPALTKDGALDLLRRFEELYDSVYDTAGSLKSAKFNTKSEFYEAFSEVMTAKEAEYKFGGRMTEKQDGLYFIPMDGIVTWSFDLPYEFVKVNEKKYTITQHSVSDLHGHTKLSVTIEYTPDSRWIITQYRATDQKHQADEEPSLTEDGAIDIINQFEIIKNDIYPSSENKFKTKNEFYGAFANVMTKEEAERIFSDRIEERDNGLYFIPMDGLQRWSFEIPHEFKKINENKYTLSQYREDDLNGYGTFYVTFEYMNGTKWMITHYGK